MARPLSDSAHAEMVAAAQQIITNEGIGSCTIDAVARRSGVAKSTIYRHFANADALAIAAIDGLLAEVAIPDHGSLRDDLFSIVTAFRDVVRHDSFRRLFVSMLSRAATDEAFASVYHEAQEARHAPLRIAIQRGMARGEVDPNLDLERAMYFVQGPFVAKRLVELAELSDSDVDFFLDLILKALAP
jgi:AcrR family transcriptional regulator